jgi:iron complex outermembrane receptor protein
MGRRVWPLCGVAIGVLQSASLSAQSPPPVESSAARSARANEDDSEEIIITARKREERLIDVPQSITALTSADLGRLDATQFRDFANTVPALSFTTQGAGSTQISLRGVTAGSDVGPTVGIYVDEVPIGSSSALSNASSLALDVGLFDLERVEVLRGPQGTLYGASAMGGLLKYVTPRPDPSAIEGAAQLRVSDTRHGGASYQGAASMNVPLGSDQVALRAGGFYSRDGGYIDSLARGDNDVNRARIYGGRLDFYATPAPGLSVRITGFAQNIRRNGLASADYTLAGVPVDGSLDQRRALAEPFDQEFRLVAATLGYDLGGVNLTSISSYQTVRSNYRWDISALFVPVLAQFGLPFSAVGINQRRTTDKFAQEVRLSSGASGRLEWQIGGFYTYEDTGNQQLVVPYDSPGVVSPINVLTVSLPSIYEEVAAFGNATFHVTERFDLSAGVRYARNSQRFEQIGSGALIGSAPEARSQEGVVTYLANARYELSPRANVYIRYATGYRPGGPNFLVRDAVTGELLAPTTFDSDRLASYEAGIKGETRDRTFGYDFSAYYIDWNNIQVSTSAGGLSVIANAGGASVRGAELTLSSRPMEDLSFAGAFAYQDAQLEGASPAIGGRDGERLPNVPKFTATLTADYIVASGSRVRPTIGGTLRFVSDRTSSFDASQGNPQYRLPDYVTVDFRLGLQIGPVDAQVFIRNAFDERGQLSAQTAWSGAGGPAQVAILQPRTIGISARTNF